MISDQDREIQLLREQILRTDAHTEKECAEHLKNLAWTLLPSLDGTIIYIDCEQLCSTGRVDMIVIAEILEVGGETRKGAYVWELKAPQLPLFYLRTKTQACPTAELFKAENQLLHYHHSVAHSGHLRTTWGIVSPDHVRFGGIVMGRDYALVSCKEEDLVPGRARASLAYNIREAVFYRPFDIRLWTWDKILTILENQTLSHKKIMGDPATRINLKSIPDVSPTIVE